MKLTDCINNLVTDWIDSYSEEAAVGNLESMLIYSKLLLRGASTIPQDIKQSLYWLKKACKIHPEAAFRLGKIYQKGKYVSTDIPKAYFYFRLATLSRCKCGVLREEYHSKKISNVHPCFPNEAIQEINKLQLSNELKNQLEQDFLIWKTSNLR